MQFIARVCNYSDEPYELVADGKEHVPEAGGKLSRSELACSDSNVSVLPDKSSASNLTATFRTSRFADGCQRRIVFADDDVGAEHSHHL